MSHFTNRFSESVGERALQNCAEFKLHVWKQSNGNVVADFKLCGTLGKFSFDDDDDEEEGGAAIVREPTDLSLLRDLLDRFQRKDGEL
jgi:hypothetical protein